jgi:L-rhamnose isomerase
MGRCLGKIFRVEECVMTDRVFAAWNLAKERYAEAGVDAEAALETLASVSLSLHCWQGDDVRGFEGAGDLSDGGIAATGNHPGRARTADELREDLDQAFALIPGAHRLNLHAIYAEPPSPVNRDELLPEHFGRWIGWAVDRGLGLDFNPTFFAHPRASDGFTLSHPDADVRRFWIAHGRACREIGAAMGRATGSPCVTNVWVPDGYKDLPADRLGPRKRLLESLDEVFAPPLDPTENLDSVESKLFGIGSEAYVAGSHEFYLGYAIRRGVLYCLDTGHFHPTEFVADKVSSVLLHLDRLLLHVSRGVRWDSDHVVTLSDDPIALAREIVRGGFLDRVHWGLDYFDASINRVAAWIIGARNLQKAILLALLSPTEALRHQERIGDLTARLAIMEGEKTLPFGAVWDYHCENEGVPRDDAWLPMIQAYEERTLEIRR